MNMANLMGVVFICFDGRRYELTYDPRVETIQMERRDLADALRAMADLFDQQADEMESS